MKQPDYSDMKYMPIEFQSTFSKMQTITINDIKQLSKKAS